MRYYKPPNGRVTYAKLLPAEVDDVLISLAALQMAAHNEFAGEFTVGLLEWLCLGNDMSRGQLATLRELLSEHELEVPEFGATLDDVTIPRGTDEGRRRHHLWIAIQTEIAAAQIERVERDEPRRALPMAGGESVSLPALPVPRVVLDDPAGQVDLIELERRRELVRRLNEALRDYFA